MYYVYILQSLKDFKFYIGCTSLGPEIRLIEYHNKGLVKSTRYRIPFILVYFEEYNNKSDAYKREYFLKSPRGYKEKLEITNKYSKS